MLRDLPNGYWEKSVPDRGNRACKGPGVGVRWVRLRSRRIGVAGTQ